MLWAPKWWDLSITKEDIVYIEERQDVYKNLKTVALLSSWVTSHLHTDLRSLQKVSTYKNVKSQRD